MFNAVKRDDEDVLATGYYVGRNHIMYVDLGTAIILPRFFHTLLGSKDAAGTELNPKKVTESEGIIWKVKGNFSRP